MRAAIFATLTVGLVWLLGILFVTVPQVVIEVAFLALLVGGATVAMWVWFYMIFKDREKT